MKNKGEKIEKRNVRITVNLTNAEYAAIYTIFSNVVNKYGTRAPKWATFIHCALIFGVQDWAEGQ